MLALLWARADGRRLARLGHQMARYGTYLVPTLAGMDAICGLSGAAIRRDADTRRLPAAARRELARWLDDRFFSSTWTARDFANWRRGMARYHRFVRGFYRLGGRVLVGTDCLKACPGFLYHEARPPGRLRSSAATVLRAATAAAADTLGRRTSAGSRRAPPPTSSWSEQPARRLADTRAVTAAIARGRLFDPQPFARRPIDEDIAIRPRARRARRARHRARPRSRRGPGLVVGVAAPVTGNLARSASSSPRAPSWPRTRSTPGAGSRGARSWSASRTTRAILDAVSVAQKFASDDRVLAVLGHYSSSACFAAIPVYTRPGWRPSRRRPRTPS
jgi:hypothetical protein